MYKHRKKRILGVLIIFAFVVAIGSFVGIHNLLATKETTNVSRTKTAAKTTDGSKCKDVAYLRDHYKVQVDYEVTDTSLIAHLTAEKGSFSIDNWSSDIDNPFLVNPQQAGVLSKDNPIDLVFRKDSSASVVVHFILAETDELCLSYNDATTDETGKKVGTYDFNMNFELNDLTSTSLEVNNENYNGMCRVIRDGTNFSDYSSYLKGITSADIEKYNATTNSKALDHYRTILPFCFPDTSTGGIPSVTFTYDDETLGGMIVAAVSSFKIINSSGSTTSRPDGDAFMEAFQDAKDAAFGSGHNYTIPEGATLEQIKSILSADNKLTCDWKLQPQKDEAGNIIDYYVNKDYYYAIQTEEEELTYEHQYTGGTQYTDGGACKRTCEESVVVEYGPPVASKAGLCFEYKVKVTSRVVCNTDVKGLIAPPITSVCTPVPICNDIAGFENQGGPTEEYDACIQECDGGKYSQSCSNKCYDEVYGDDSKKESNPLALNYEDAVVSPVAIDFPGYAGKYKWNGNVIYWENSGTSETYGRWYSYGSRDQRTRSDHSSGAYHAADNGFKREVYGNDDCDDPCEWTSCSKDTYLNEEEASKSYSHNLQIYNNALSSCQAAASCTTKTAYFEISVDYLHANESGNIVKENIKFPASTQASLPSGDNQTTSSPQGTNIFLSDGEDYKGYDGCYVSSDAKDWYQAEWSFPGTWINNKTGEISYEDKMDDKLWHLQEDKFCIPLDAQSVNTKWWEWSEVGRECYTEAEIEEEIKDNYNIHAKTTNFGYFGWDFTFECFYALRNEVCDTSIDGCCDGPDPEPDPPGPGTTIPTRDYAFRIIDTSDMFPETSTSTEEDSVGEGYSKTGRTPGYNWNLNGEVIGALTAKNSNYAINPTALIADIQQRQSSIYDGTKYLDYRFVLDTEDLAEIRSYNNQRYNGSRDMQYTDYLGNTTIKNGVTVYESELINKYATKQGTPGVNNDGEDD